MSEQPQSADQNPSPSVFPSDPQGTVHQLPSTKETVVQKQIGALSIELARVNLPARSPTGENDVFGDGQLRR